MEIYQNVAKGNESERGETGDGKTPDTMQPNPYYIQTTPTSLGEGEYQEIV